MCMVMPTQTDGNLTENLQCRTPNLTPIEKVFFNAWVRKTGLAPEDFVIARNVSDGHLEFRQIRPVPARFDPKTQTLV